MYAIFNLCSFNSCSLSIYWIYLYSSIQFFVMKFQVDNNEYFMNSILCFIAALRLQDSTDISQFEVDCFSIPIFLLKAMKFFTNIGQAFSQAKHFLQFVNLYLKNQIDPLSQSTYYPILVGLIYDILEGKSTKFYSFEGMLFWQICKIIQIFKKRFHYYLQNTFLDTHAKNALIYLLQLSSINQKYINDQMVKNIIISLILILFLAIHFSFRLVIYIWSSCDYYQNILYFLAVLIMKDQSQKPQKYKLFYDLIVKQINSTTKTQQEKDLLQKWPTDMRQYYDKVVNCLLATQNSNQEYLLQAINYLKELKKYGINCYSLENSSKSLFQNLKVFSIQLNKDISASMAHLNLTIQNIKKMQNKSSSKKTKLFQLIEQIKTAISNKYLKYTHQSMNQTTLPIKKQESSKQQTTANVIKVKEIQIQTQKEQTTYLQQFQINKNSQKEQIEKLQEIQKKLNKQVSRLQNQLNQSKHSKQELLADFGAKKQFSEKIEQVQQKYECIKGQVKFYKTQNYELKQKCHMLEEQLKKQESKKIKQQISIMNQQLTNKFKVLENNYVLLNSQKQNYSEKNKKLEENINSLNLQKQKLKKTIENFQSQDNQNQIVKENQQLKKQCQKLKDQILNKQYKDKKLSENLSKLQQKTINIINQLNNLKQELTIKIKQKAKLLQQNKNLESKINQKELEVMRVRQSQQKIKIEFSQAQKKNNQNNQEKQLKISQLQQKISTGMNINQKQNDMIQKLNQTIITCCQQKTVLSEQNKKYQQQLTAQVNLNAKLKQQKEQLESKYIQLQQSSDEALKNEINLAKKIIKQKQHMQIKYTQLQESKLLIQEAAIQLKSDIYKFKDQLQKQNQLLTEAKRQNNRISSQLSATKSIAAQLESKLKQRQNIITHKNINLSESIESLKTTKKQLNSIIQINQQLKQKILHLERATQQKQYHNIFLQKSIIKLKSNSSMSNSIAFFQGDIFNSQNNQAQLTNKKEELINLFQSHLNKRITNTFPIFKYDPLNKTNMHEYIDNKPSIMVFIKTEHALIGGYYSGAINASQLMVDPAFLFSVDNMKIYPLKKYDPISNTKYRAVVYDQFYCIFGNAEIRVRTGEKKIFSNFGVGKSNYEYFGKKIEDFLKVQTRQVPFEFLQFYQITFQNQIIEEERPQSY